MEGEGTQKSTDQGGLLGSIRWVPGVLRSDICRAVRAVQRIVRGPLDSM